RAGRGRGAREGAWARADAGSAGLREGAPAPREEAPGPALRGPRRARRGASPGEGGGVRRRGGPALPGASDDAQAAPRARPRGLMETRMENFKRAMAAAASAR